MSRRCTVCDHPQRKQIDRALVSGESLTKLAQTHGLSTSAIFRHRKEHLATLLARGQDMERDERARDLVQHQRETEDAETAHALDLHQQLKAINATCFEVLRKAREDAKASTQLQAVDRIQRQLALQAQWLGAPGSQETEDSDLPSHWPLIRQVVLDALNPFPKARIAVAEALGALADLEQEHASL